MNIHEDALELQRCDSNDMHPAGTHEQHRVFSTNDRNLCNVGSGSQGDHHVGTLSAGILCPDSEEVEGFESLVQARRLLPLDLEAKTCFELSLVPYAFCSL